MLFEQAFYTRGINQISRYKEGLGICAASNEDMEFLDRCCTVGSRLDTERSGKVAEFVYYEKEFDAFIGVSVGPPRDGSGGIVNKLCHLFLPVPGYAASKPSECFLKYPFRQNVNDGEALPRMEIQPDLTEKDFDRICAQYGLDETKLAILLQLLFNCIFDGSDRLLIIIDEKKHPVSEYSQIAREMTWFFSVLLQTDADQLNIYQKRLSYGVHTENNAQLARVIYTADNDSIQGKKIYLDEIRSDEAVPAMYQFLAGMVRSDLNQYHAMTGDLLSMIKGQRVTTELLQMAYIRWRLDHIPDTEELAEGELPISLRGLVRDAQNSKWQEAVLYDFVMRQRFCKEVVLIDIWQYLLRDQLKNYDHLDEKFQKKIIDRLIWFSERMYRLNKKNYMICHKGVQRAGLSSEVVGRLWNQTDSVIALDITEIEDVDAFISRAAIYSVLNHEEKFRKMMTEKAIVLYDASGQKDRSHISDAMRHIIGSQWDSICKDRITSKDSWDTYKDFLDKESEVIEKDQESVYYRHFLDFARQYSKENNKEVWQELNEWDQRLAGVIDVDDDDREQFRQYDKIWRIHCLHAYTLEQLTVLNPSEDILYSWLQIIADRIERGDTLSDQVFENLILKKSAQYYNEAIGELYENVLWRACDGDLLRQMRYGITICRPKHNFWDNDEISNIKVSVFEKIHGYFDDYPGLTELKDCTGKSVRGVMAQRCYCIWETVTAGRNCGDPIRELEKKAEGNEHSLRGFIGEINKIAKESIFDQNIGFLNSIRNFIQIQVLAGKLYALQDNIHKRCGQYREIFKDMAERRSDSVECMEMIETEIQLQEEPESVLDKRYNELTAFAFLYNQCRKSDAISLDDEIARYIIACEDMGMSDETEVRRVRERCEELMADFRTAWNEFHEEMNGRRQELQAIIDEYKNLEQELQNIKPAVDEIEQIRNNCRENEKRIAENARNCAENAECSAEDAGKCAKSAEKCETYVKQCEESAENCAEYEALSKISVPENVIIKSGADQAKIETVQIQEVVPLPDSVVNKLGQYKYTIEKAAQLPVADEVADAEDIEEDDDDFNPTQM